MDNRYEECIDLLYKLQKSKQQIPLGAIQRWVRDLNINTLSPNRINVLILDFILRCVNNISFTDDIDSQQLLR